MPEIAHKIKKANKPHGDWQVRSEKFRLAKTEFAVPGYENWEF